MFELLVESEDATRLFMSSDPKERTKGVLSFMGMCERVGHRAVQQIIWTEVVRDYALALAGDKDPQKKLDGNLFLMSVFPGASQEPIKHEDFNSLIGLRPGGNHAIRNKDLGCSNNALSPHP